MRCLTQIRHLGDPWSEAWCEAFEGRQGGVGLRAMFKFAFESGSVGALGWLICWNVMFNITHWSFIYPEDVEGGIHDMGQWSLNLWKKPVGSNDKWVSWMIILPWKSKSVVCWNHWWSKSLPPYLNKSLYWKTIQKIVLGLPGPRLPSKSPGVPKWSNRQAKALDEMRQQGT